MTAFVLSKPVPPSVTGLDIQSGLRTTTLVWDVIDSAVFEIYSGPTNDIAAAALLATSTSNNFALTALETAQYFWVRAVNIYGGTSPFTGPVQYAPLYITSNDVIGSTPTSGGTSVGTANMSPTITNYGTWYSASKATFTPNDDTVLSISMYLISTASSPSTSNLQNVEVWARSRLYDVTAGADVPAGTKQYLLYRNSSGSFMYGNLANITNFNENFVTGFRGILIPGHEYELYAEIMKSQFGGGTITLQINGSGVSASSSATI